MARVSVFRLCVVDAVSRVRCFVSSGGLLCPRRWVILPGAAFDPSATSPAVRALGYYNTDSAILDRSFLSKFTYELGSDAHPTRIVLSALGTTHYNDKTGNGDNDYFPASTAAEVGTSDLNSYLAKHPAGCGGNPNEFATKNYNGQPVGFGPDGAPDGAPACETVGTFVADNAGPEGTGTAYQNLRLNAYHLRSATPLGATSLVVDAFTNVYQQDYERPYQLPFIPTPPVPAGNFVYNAAYQYDTDSEYARAVSSGFTISDSVEFGHDDLSGGYFLDNNAYRWGYVGSAAGASALANPAPAVVSRDTSFLLRDSYGLANGRTTLYANENLKHNTATNSSYSDARFSVVTLPTKSDNDVFRLAAGSTSVQPWAIDLVNTFTPVTDTSFLSGLSCADENSIGAISGTQLTPRPERAFDEELSYSHRFSTDSYAQLTGYNELIYNKILTGVLIPVSSLPAGVISPSTITHYESIDGCGATNLAPLAVTGNQNVGFVTGRGYDLQSAPISFLEANLNYLVGGQIPGVALHSGWLALDQRLHQNLEFRLTDYYVGSDNERFAPAYTYADFDTKVNGKSGSVDFAVQNLFNQDSGYYDYIGEGVLQGMNQYATAANYASKTSRTTAARRVLAAGFQADDA
jgi:hypothetical protein